MLDPCLGFFHEMVRQLRPQEEREGRLVGNGAVYIIGPRKTGIRVGSRSSESVKQGKQRATGANAFLGSGWIHRKSAGRVTGVTVGV